MISKDMDISGCDGRQARNVFWTNLRCLSEAELRNAGAGTLIVSDDASQQGRLFAGYPVLAPESLAMLSGKMNIFVLDSNYDRARSFLIKMGLREGSDFFWAHRQCGPKNRILFISHEMSYTGAPLALLNMCKAAQRLGYEPLIWSMKEGSFSQEFKKIGLAVSVVPSVDLDSPAQAAAIFNCQMAVCNTCVTYGFVSAIQKYIPVAWFIHEGTGIESYTKGHQECAQILREAHALCCVSQYAALPLKKMVGHEVIVIHNCVEDESNLADKYEIGSGEKVKFALFGTIEHRKGQDVLLAAYNALPQDYKERIELYFAGLLSNPKGDPARRFLETVEREPNVHYLGLITNATEKIKRLSQMDVIIVASRDESCSLVALEGAMLSKPLIVTENTGAKYMVCDENGLIVPPGNVDALVRAIQHIVDNKTHLAEMGRTSRRLYESSASLNSYEKDMAKLFRLGAQRDWHRLGLTLY